MARLHTRPKRRGTTVVEFAFIAIVFFMFLFGVVEYVRLTMMVQLLNNAAREGARTAVVSQSTMTTAQIQSVVTNALAGQSSQLQSITVQVYQINPATMANVGSWNNTTFGQAIAVQVNATYAPMLPSLLRMGSTMPLQAQAVMYSEGD